MSEGEFDEIVDFGFWTPFRGWGAFWLPPTAAKSGRERAKSGQVNKTP
jgi:hypothetical protein